MNIRHNVEGNYDTRLNISPRLAERSKYFLIANGTIHASQENLLCPLLRYITPFKGSVYANLRPDSFTAAGGKWPPACVFAERIAEFAVAVAVVVDGVLPTRYATGQLNQAESQL